MGQQHSSLDHTFIKDNNNSPMNINVTPAFNLTDITDHCSIVVTISIPVNVKILLILSV